MTTEQFCYWMQGFFEISNPKELNAKQIQIIQDHLNLVFNKKTLDRNQEPEKKDILDTLKKKNQKSWLEQDETNPFPSPFPGNGGFHGDTPVVLC